jgi:hypothetical protein
MTKRDYIIIAECVSEMTNREAANDFARRFARAASFQNPRFDYDKFYKACGVTGYKKE